MTEESSEKNLSVKIIYGGYKDVPSSTSQRAKGHDSPPTMNIVYGSYKNGPSKGGTGHMSPPVPSNLPANTINAAYKSGPSTRGKAHKPPLVPSYFLKKR